MDQKTERFLRVEAIFLEALEAPTAERTNLIADRCHGDRELMAEVSSLLEACETVEELSASRRPASDSGGHSQPVRKRIGP